MEFLTNAIFYKGLQLLLIDGGAIAFAYMGYRLYMAGITVGQNTATAEVGPAKSRLFRFAVSGRGPGLLFMFFGAVVLSISLTSGGAFTNTTVATNPLGQNQDLRDRIAKIEEAVSKVQDRTNDASATAKSAQETSNKFDSRLSELSAVSADNTRFISETVNILRKERPGFEIPSLSRLDEVVKKIGPKPEGLPIPVIASTLSEVGSARREVPKSDAGPLIGTPALPPSITAPTSTPAPAPASASPSSPGGFRR